MEHIKNIEIKNFKSIRHQKIEGCKRINMFIGYPNVGKSNILEALGGMVYAHSPNVNFKNLCRYENSPGIFFNGDIGASHFAQVTINEDLLLHYKYVSNAVLNISAGWYHSVDLKTFTIDEIDIEQAQNSFRFDVNDGNPEAQYFFENNNLPLVKKYEFSRPRSAIQPDSNSSLSVPFGENLSDILGFDKELRKDVADFFKRYDLKLLLDKGGKEIRVAKILDEETIFSIPFLQIADTLQRLIFYKTAIKSNQNSILLLEEPESHMFPPYIKKFTSDIIFDETNQFFIATHSPYVITELIEEVQDDLAIYVVDYDKGETVIKRLTDEEVSEVAQYGIDLFFNLESYLERYEQPHSA